MNNSGLRISFVLVMAMMVSMLLGSCYGQRGRSQKNHHAVLEYSERQIDSLSFFSVHHYANNYNFVVKKDSLVLLRQSPEEFLDGMATDSFRVGKGVHLVVADIRIIPADTIDSVWVQLANDSSAFGWSRESELLSRVMPDDPISQFISEFSDGHVIIFLAIIVVFGAGYLLRSIFRRNARIVHFNDINSFYPTLLCLVVASSATFYASIQVFAPQMWQHFYFHPTLNPFSVPFALGIFLASVWAMLIIGLATVDVVRHQLPFGEAMLYLGGLAAVCAIDYIIFSVTTLYYIGYLLLVAYLFFAFRQYYRCSHAQFLCGNCGEKLYSKGRCPHCGAINE